MELMHIYHFCPSADDKETPILTVERYKELGQNFIRFPEFPDDYIPYDWQWNREWFEEKLAEVRAKHEGSVA